MMRRQPLRLRRRGAGSSRLRRRRRDGAAGFLAGRLLGESGGALTRSSGDSSRSRLELPLRIRPSRQAMPGPRRVSSLLEHDLFRKPVSTLGSSPRAGFFGITLEPLSPYRLPARQDAPGISRNEALFL